MEDKEISPDFIQLILHKREAQALMAASDAIGGHPDTTPRGLISQIRDRLFSLGVKKNFCFKTTGSLYFKEYGLDKEETSYDD